MPELSPERRVHRSPLERQIRTFVDIPFYVEKLNSFLMEGFGDQKIQQILNELIEKLEQKDLSFIMFLDSIEPIIKTGQYHGIIPLLKFYHSSSHREKKSVKRLVNVLLKLKKDVDRGYKFASKQEKSYQHAVRRSGWERLDTLLRNRKR